MKKHFLPFLFLLLAAACGEDRSGEVPYAPTVRTNAATAVADSCTMEGEVLAAPNSPVTACGFYYGNDTLSVKLASTDSAQVFRAVADSLAAGRYYCVAFATNGIGTSYGDTLYFYIGS